MKQEIEKIDHGTIVTPKGFHAAGLYSGVKRKRKDLGVIYCENQANAAAVYTLNKVVAAPITVTKETVHKSKQIQAVIVNSGNANACTGLQGEKDAYAMQTATAKKFGIDEGHVAVASTGIIGLHMPMDKIIPHIEQLELGQTADHADAFEEAILTTDTFQKSTCYEASINGKKVTMAGAAKGSGMIEPNMGTMLGFITTDAVIAPEWLDRALKEAVNNTFNCITVDGDTSTNDMVIVLASELAANDSLTTDHPDWKVFVQLLRQVSEDLAKQIARDGEGATKLIEVEVKNAETTDDAKIIAKSIVGSSLVKTMVFGTDANWGRVIAAAGYSGVDINPNTIDMSVGPITLLKDSEPVNFSEEEATAYLENDTVKIIVDVKLGDQDGKAWGCDLTYDYVKINASYRT